MKTWKSFIIIGLALLLNSCIIKSLQPFYTPESLSYNEKFIGTWTDSKNGQWKIQSSKTMFSDSINVKKTQTVDDKWTVEVKVNVDEVEKVSESDLESNIKYQLLTNGYLITYKNKNKEAFFIAMPFKIDNQYFLDFIPFMYEDDSVNDLVNQHLIETHSVAKVDINSDNEISFSWLNESKVKNLFENKKLRLKHEKIGYEEDLLITASSSESYSFLKKYMNADIEDKWKKSDMLMLTKTNAKP